MEQSRLASEVELVWQFLWQRKDGFFVEVGAYEPQIGSQTWFLEERDWRGILVEPQSRFMSACVRPVHSLQELFVPGQRIRVRLMLKAMGVVN